MLRVSIFQRMKNKQKGTAIGELFDKVRKHEKVVNKEKIPISKMEQELVTEEIQQIDNTKCMFSSNRRGEITCSKNGRFTVFGNPTKKCELFPCTFYESITRGTILIHDGADQFGNVDRFEEEKK
jgi:hypothetical protein